MSIANKLTSRYVVALVLIALLGIGANLVLKFLISTQDSFASVINICGRQRMLSQRISMMAHRLVIEKDSAQFHRISAELKSAIELMEKSHHALINGDAAMNISPDIAKTAAEIYFGSPLYLDNQVTLFLQSAKKLLATAPADLSYNTPELQQIISVAHKSLLAALEEAVKHFEAQSRGQIRYVQRIENVILISTLICLLLEALLIFRPMVSWVTETHLGLEDALDGAVKANKAKSDFLRNVSHEIRTPMNGIIGAANLLNDEPLSENTRELSQLIKGAAVSLMMLLNDLIDYSRIESGDIDINDEVFDLDAVLREVIKIWQYAADHKGLTLSAEYTTNLAAHYVGDPNRIRQILYHLMDNAIKFTEIGSVGIVVREEELEHVNLISIDVEDTGIGIPAERLNDIFLDFSQGDPSVTRKFGGVGLGLTIARAIANKMGGDLTVQSGVGRGSIFTLQILLNRAAESISAQLSAGESQAMSDSHLAIDILVVEDNHVNQIITRKFLEKVHARVTLVNNGQEAIDLIREKHFDLILMDIQMPVMDGISATKAIRSLGGEYSAIPIIAVTANTIADRASCIEAGMNGFIMKPITGKMLFDEMKSHLQ